MTLLGIIRELHYMGYKTTRFSKVDSEPCYENSIIPINITGWTRFKKLTKEEIYRMESRLLPGICLHVNRYLFRIKLWHITIVSKR